MLMFPDCSHSQLSNSQIHIFQKCIVDFSLDSHIRKFVHVFVKFDIVKFDIVKFEIVKLYKCKFLFRFVHS
jgi:hypothetical protein